VTGTRRAAQVADALTEIKDDLVRAAGTGARAAAWPGAAGGQQAAVGQEAGGGAAPRPPGQAAGA